MKKLFLSLLLVAASTTFYASASTLDGAANGQSISMIEVSSSEWDDILDEYEAIINKLIPLIKKSKEGDPTATMESAKVATKMLNLQKKLEKAKSEMTAAQVARFSKIALKYANAIR